MGDASHSGSVILHYGAMTPKAMDKAARLLGKTAVIDTGAARLSGASFAFGDPATLAGLKDRLVPGATDAARMAHPELSSEAIAWLARGERGMSSVAIFTRLTGSRIDPGETDAHPHDPDDLRRCRLLLEAVPEFAGRIGELATLSPEWARLVKAWDSLCALMDEEGYNWRAGLGSFPKTYAEMKRVLRTR